MEFLAFNFLYILYKTLSLFSFRDRRDLSGKNVSLAVQCFNSIRETMNFQFDFWGIFEIYYQLGLDTKEDGILTFFHFYHCRIMYSKHALECVFIELIGFQFSEHLT